MIHLLILFAACTGFAGLCVARPRHQRDLIGRRLSHNQARMARAAGWAGIIAALAIAVAGLGWAYGVIIWIGHLSIAAALVVALLAWRTHRALIS